MKLLKIFALIFAGLILQSSTLPRKPAAAVQWMSFEEAIERAETEQRKIVIDIYTDWCGWCKVMDKKTFQDPAVAKLLNENVYPVKFNAEQREEIRFNGKLYRFLPNGTKGTHELAIALLNNQLSFPSVVFVEEGFKSVLPIAGYQKPKEFHKALSFFASDWYSKGEAGWKAFEESYRSPYAARRTKK